jgi:hypothetical protein
LSSTEIDNSQDRPLSSVKYCVSAHAGILLLNIVHYIEKGFRIVFTKDANTWQRFNNLPHRRPGLTEERCGRAGATQKNKAIKTTFSLPSFLFVLNINIYKHILMFFIDIYKYSHHAQKQSHISKIRRCPILAFEITLFSAETNYETP